MENLISDLRRVYFLDVLADEDLKILLRHSKVRQFRSGEGMMTQGQPGEYFHILRRGAVEVIAKAPNGDTVRTRNLNAPAFLGELSFLTGETRIADVVARSDVEVLELNREAFTQLFSEHPGSLNAVSEVLAAHVTEHREASSKTASGLEEGRGSKPAA